MSVTECVAVRSAAGGHGRRRGWGREASSRSPERPVALALRRCRPCGDVRREACEWPGRPPTPLDSPSDALSSCARLGGRQVRDTPPWLSRLQATVFYALCGHGLAPPKYSLTSKTIFFTVFGKIKKRSNQSTARVMTMHLNLNLCRPRLLKMLTTA